jgi:hypothetical protein
MSWIRHTRLEVDNTLNRDETLTLQMTHKTFDTFASDWTQCTNVAFDKLLKKFQLQNAGHKVRYIMPGTYLEIVGFSA